MSCSIGSCSSTCRGGCDGSCGDCGSGCAGGCQGSCDGGCSGGCSGCGGCGSSCSGDCDGGCSGCSGCGSGCSNGCSGGCKATCSDDCTGGCKTGCKGCSACTGTCEASCNDACKATNRAQDIINLGKNIQTGNISNYNDFLNLKKEIRNEIIRRSKTPSEDVIFNPDKNIPAHAVSIPAKVVQNIFDNAKIGFISGFKSTQVTNNPYKEIKSGDIVRASDYTEVIKYTKDLMITVVPKA